MVFRQYWILYWIRVMTYPMINCQWIFFVLSSIEQKNWTIRLTNTCLHVKGKKTLNKREFYNFLSRMILIKRFDFMYRASLWSPTSTNKYTPSVKIGPMTGMKIRRFANIWREMRWGNQPNESPDNIYHAWYGWLLIDEMVEIFNKHREDAFIPS